MTLPDFETLVIERLVVCLGEIPGIRFVSENPPTLKAGISDTPYAFPLVGAMLSSIPQQADGAGRVVVTRIYTVKVFGVPTNDDKDGARGMGSLGYKALRLLMAPIRQYWTDHPFLETTTGDKSTGLRYMKEPLTYQEAGIEDDQAEGRYVLRFNLTISMSDRITTV